MVDVFLSYAIADHQSVKAILFVLSDELKRAFRALPSKGIEINLRADESSLDWEAPDRIRAAQNGNCFLIPLLAPAYLDAPICRDEATGFLNLEREAGRQDLIFPIYLRDVDVLENPERRASHELAQALYEHRPADWRDVAAGDYSASDFAADDYAVGDNDANRIKHLAADLASRIKAASKRVTRDPLPDIPEQGPGVRFRINEDGLIDRAPDEPHDVDENEARLNSLKSGLIEACDRLLGSSGHNTLGFVLDTVRAYRGAIDRPLVDVQYTDVWRHGQRLQNLADAATRDVDRLEPSLEDDQHAALNDVLDLHGPFMLSTAEGRALQAMADRYQATRDQQERQNEAVQAFKEAIEDSTGLVTDAVKQVIAEASDELGKGRYPERAAITAETTNRNFLSTAGKASAVFVGGAAVAGIIENAIAGSEIGNALVGVSTEAINAAGQASKQFLLSHQMVLKGLVACSVDSLAWLNHLIAWLGRRAPAFTEQPTPTEAPEIVTNDFWTPGSVFRDIDEPWCPKMVVIPPGVFMMGSPVDENGTSDNEIPQHRLIIKGPFALCQFPITFEEFDFFCDATNREKPKDRGWGRGLRPVIHISWYDAVAYSDWLSERTQALYHLPSEAEWEYACRAGIQTAYAFGETIDEKQANFDRAIGKTTIVGEYPANAFNLFDMHGNVWEWCKDHYQNNYSGAPADSRPLILSDGTKRTLRGGSWYSNAQQLRSARRGGNKPNGGDGSIGFRCARILK